MSKQNLKYAALGAAVLAVLLIFMGLFLFHQGTEQKALFSEDQMAISGPGVGHHVFHVELAESPEQLAQGLMYRDHLGADSGMLFIFPTVQEVTMWMHNTQIPLDMLFVDNAGKIIYIAPNNRPYDDAQVTSHGLIRAVVEINGGRAAELGIAVGDTITNARFTKATQF